MKLSIDKSEIEEARWFDREELKLMLRRQHPDGLAAPPPIAIAHHIIRAFVEKGGDVPASVMAAAATCAAASICAPVSSCSTRCFTSRISAAR